MANLALDGDRLAILHAVLTESVHNKERAVRDYRMYADMEAERERKDPFRIAPMSSASMRMVADSIEESVGTLKKMLDEVKSVLLCEQNIEISERIESEGVLA